ncbi:MAG: uroporphyrinogen decarboxylase family protein [Lentisphaeria bacterium]|nr:uroporphyrinogen decarboxylase family protein [Lentisphaeria bacterium]
MTPRERLLAAFSCGEVDRPPVMPNFTRWIRGRTGSTSELQFIESSEQFGFDPIIMYAAYFNHPLSSGYVYRPDEGSYRDLPDVNVDLRVENYRDHTVHIRRFETPAGPLTDRISWSRPGMGYGDGPNPHRDEPLVKSMDDVEALKFLYPLPRQDVISDLRLWEEIVGGRAVVEFLAADNAGGWGMESLGPEMMLMSAIENKDLLKAVLRVCQDQHLRNFKAVLEAGHKHFCVSWFQCGPSVGWSPANIEEFFLPLIRESVELVSSYGACYRFQDDGKMLDVIPHLVDLGTDIIGGLQPPPIGDCDFGEIMRRWGGKACFMGGLDPVHVMERGTPELVRSEVHKLLSSAGDGRGVVVSTAEAFGPEAPEENLCALSQSVRDVWNELS